MQLGVRISKRQHAKLAELAREAGVTKSDLVRRLIDAAADGTPISKPEAPTEAELMDLLAEKARAGNVGAMRALLARTEESDPRAEALEALQALARERRS